MEKDKINFTTEGFLKNIIYIADLPNLLYEYKDRFGEAESLIVNLKELILGFKPEKELVIFSEDGKNIEINIFESKDKNKDKLVNPSSHSVYKVIRYILESAVEKYSEKFPAE